MLCRRGESGQVLPLVAALGAIILALGFAALQLGLAGLAAAQAQTGADLAALAAARELESRVMESVTEEEVLREILWRAAAPVAQGSRSRLVAVTLPSRDRWPPVAVQVEVVAPGPLGTDAAARAVAAITARPERTISARGGGYSGPLVFRDGKPMCPAVARAFDAMADAAKGAGVTLIVTSGFRSDAEQAELFRRRPDPRWVARPGQSRHRDATELDIGGPGAWAWLAANGGRFGFAQRYSWEPWHWGYLAGCGTSGEGTIPAWVPARFRGSVRDAAAASGLPIALLAALLKVESNFDPRAVSPAGAQGIAQFMPGTARAVGLRDAFDPRQAIPAAAKLLARHRARFGSDALALAAYNAGPTAVARFGGVPPYPETAAYVARVLVLAGHLTGPRDVRLVGDLDDT